MREEDLIEVLLEFQFDALEKIVIYIKLAYHRESKIAEAYIRKKITIHRLQQHWRCRIKEIL